jgi:hypothetical protein
MKANTHLGKHSINQGLELHGVKLGVTVEIKEGNHLDGPVETFSVSHVFVPFSDTIREFSGVDESVLILVEKRKQKFELFFVGHFPKLVDKFELRLKRSDFQLHEGLGILHKLAHGLGGFFLFLLRGHRPGNVVSDSFVDENLFLLELAYVLLDNLVAGEHDQGLFQAVDGIFETVERMKSGSLASVSLDKLRGQLDALVGVLESMKGIPLCQVSNGTVGVENMIRTIQFDGLGVELNSFVILASLEGFVSKVLGLRERIRREQTKLEFAENN